MMRPTAIRGLGAVAYYLGMVREPVGDDPGIDRAEVEQHSLEDYYLPVGHEAHEWFGQGARAFGLHGPGTRDQMQALLDGRAPVTGEKLGRTPLRDGVRAYDLTFSAPKSVSVMAAVLGADVEQQVLAAHEQAVKAALSVLEERATTRAGSGGAQRVDTTGITVLMVQHRTSRALDPQLHTHAIVFAKVRGVDGRWRALDATMLFRAQTVFGALYQSVLRSELSRTLGVQWGPVSKGQAEIASTAEINAVFSRRTAQVEARLGEKLSAWERAHPDRPPTRRELSILARDAARESRPRKTLAREGEQLAAEWRATAHQNGYDEATLRQLLIHRRAVELPSREEWGTHCRQIAHDAVQALEERKSVWTREELEREVAGRLTPYARLSAGEHVRTIEGVADAIARTRCIDLADHAVGHSRHLLGTPELSDPGLERYTTHDVIEQERRVVRWLAEARNSEGSPLPAQMIGTSLVRVAARDGRQMMLDPWQTEAAALAAGSQRAVLIEGPAGAGKTQALQVAVHALRHTGRQVVVLAPSALAARHVGEATGAPSENVARYLACHSRDFRDTPRLRLGPGDTLIVDEAAMLSTPHYERLLDVVQSTRLRLVLVGDQRQLAAVGRGGSFEHARELLPTVALAEPHRFAAPWEATASLSLRQAEPHAIDAYIANGRVREGAFEQMADAIVADWWSAWRAGTGEAFSAVTNEQVRYLNGRARELRLHGHEISDGRGIENRHGERIAIGDVVATRQNAPELETSDGEIVRNRDSWTVAAIARDGAVTLQSRERGAEVEVPSAYAREHVELAYFRTTHGVQGATERVAGTLVDARSGFRSLYVGMTRGVEKNVAYVVCEGTESGREVLERALRRDRADLGALRQVRLLETTVRELARNAPRHELPPAHVRNEPERELPQPDLGIGL